MLNGVSHTGYRDFVTRFDEAVHRYPGRIALIVDGQQFSYRQLYERVVNCLQLLKEAPSAYEAILLGLPRSVSLIAAMIACQYRGTPYIPIDFLMPARRVRDVLNAVPDCAVLHDSSLAMCSDLGDLPVGIAVLDMAAAPVTGMVCAIAQAGCEAYRISTSGSTGNPKLVRVTTQGCANLIDFFSGLLVQDAAMTILSSTSPSFDIFYLEYALPLANGGLLMMANEEQAASPQRLAQLLGEYRPSIYQSTPSLLKCLLLYLPKSFRFNRLLVGGEPLGQHLSAVIHARSGQAFNVYGPTETTVWAACQAIDRPGEQRIGLPIQNTSITVVDERGVEVSAGIHGRILIGGDGVALGYLGNPSLTEAKFVANPAGEGMRYDTGDIGFIDEAGRLNFVARDGDFVKINGYRIELAEIVDTLESLPFVAEAAVVHVCAPSGISSLSAFVKLDPHCACPDAVAQVYAHLGHSLPAYMRPNLLEVIDDFPRNSAGKLDRAQLANPAAALSGLAVRPVAAAGDEPMNTIITLLSSYIDVTRLREHDNFFTHGLTSMHAVSFHIALMDHWPRIELFHIFEHPTVSGLSRLAVASR